MLVVIWLIATITAIVNASCYFKTNDKVWEDPDHEPCSSPNANGFASCCDHVFGDTCGGSSFCHATHAPWSAGLSGYYLGGCTDPTFSDPSCLQVCGAYTTTDVVYNATSGLWACCYNGATGVVDCSNPGNTTFQAAPPAELFAVSSSQISTSATSTASSATSASSTIATTTTTTPVLNPTQSAVSQEPSELSIAAKAGIGVGAAIALVIALLTGAFCVRRRQQQRRDSSRDDFAKYRFGQFEPSLRNEGDSSNNSRQYMAQHQHSMSAFGPLGVQHNHIIIKNELPGLRDPQELG